ncbi:MAG: ATP-dependent DNA helicase RecG [Ponticaulis sp.]|nr:ATP-dependent DNA helicase RecG [Ponticaulis sp.]
MNRDNSLSFWFRPISSLSGAGPKLTALVTELVGGDQLRDLLLYRPAKWLDRSLRSSFDDLIFDEVQTVRGTVQSFSGASRGSKVQKVRLSDETGFLTLVFFNSNTDYLRRQFPEGKRIVVSGKIEDFHGERQITHPDYVVPEEKIDDIPLVESIYPLQAGLTNKRLSGFMRQALSDAPFPEEWLQSELLNQRKWMSFEDSLRWLHMAPSYEPDTIELARERLAYDESYARALSFRRIRSVSHSSGAVPITTAEGIRADFTNSLPFAPTSAQIRAMSEISFDLDKPEPMQRMLQGDVGAGKTTIAAYALYLAAMSGHQASVMAPTEVLARQLYEAVSAFLRPLGVATACLTGRDKGKARTELLEGVKSGQTGVLCGTHALFQEGVEFKDLALVVIDEQHRFGVNDRAKLISKGRSPHLLLMSATPIPRSLSMTVHGDVDLSILDEKPVGRQKIDTRIMAISKLPDVISGVQRAIQRGEQIFWVCSSVEEDDEHLSAISRHAILNDILPGYVDLVHGRLTAQNKEAALNRFRLGETRVLVATTVIEVGVDIPNATIMVIEGAERFGLAQLHQLRGRVGRGSKASFCLLLYSPPLGETARTRLQTLRESEDGFYIAEMDFKLRGPGDILGAAQSGIPDFHFLDLSRDQDLLAIANKHADYEFGRSKSLNEVTNDLLQLFGHDVSGGRPSA